MSNNLSGEKWPKQKTAIKSRPIILGRKRKADSNPLVETQLKRIHDDPNKDCLSSNSEQQNKGHIDGNKTPIDLVSVVSFSRIGSLTCLFTPDSSHISRSPLPYFDWANSQEVWDVMIKKDATYPRNPDMFHQHPALNPRMRVILFDWLIEVCESYRLHRETLYLTQDFVDRYLSEQKSVPKDQLQLVGVTALFIASKLEEIYPPKLPELADITDGSCTEDQIICKEMVILKSLNWNLTPITVNSWLNIYMQLAARKEKPSNTDENFLIPGFSPHRFLKLSQLLDLCMLDVDCLQFSYRTLAAAALCITMSEKIALSVSGLSKFHVTPCVEWMLPFAATVNEIGESYFKVAHVPAGEKIYNIQSHTVDLKLFENAKARQHQMLSQKSTEGITGVLTPPHSGKKRTRSNYPNS